VKKFSLVALASGIILLIVGLIWFLIPWIIEWARVSSSPFADLWEWWAAPYRQHMPEYQESLGDLVAGHFGLSFIALVVGSLGCLWLLIRRKLAR